MHTVQTINMIHSPGTVEEEPQSRKCYTSVCPRARVCVTCVCMWIVLSLHAVPGAARNRFAKARAVSTRLTLFATL